MTKLCDLANEKKCAVSLDGMSVHPERPLDLPRSPEQPSPGEEMTSALQFLGRFRKAVGAFFDNLPDE